MATKQTVKKNTSKKTGRTTSKKAPEKNIPLPQKLRRSETDHMIGGVAGGLGTYFAIDPTIIRLVFVLLFVFGGSGLLLYLILWIIVPSESQRYSSSEESIKQNAGEVKEKTTKFARDISGTDSRYFWGLFLIIIGFVFLLRNFGIFRFVRFDVIWPLALIILGLNILVKNK